jgi:Dolichyl-phosphate-mannose-protein mannosyltransferase
MAIRSRLTLTLLLVLLGSLARIGYGVARYEANISASGTNFLKLWDYDALEHVLIAKSLVENHIFKVAVDSNLGDKHLRTGADALFKAPLYELFLAGVFVFSGYSFALFFPLQSLFGGLLASIVGLISLQCFKSYRVAYLAGTAAALHPVLVNTASQPYNENLFFLLQFACLLSLTAWIKDSRIRWPIICGLSAGLAVLCRESAAPILLVVLAAMVWHPISFTTRMHAVGATLVAALLVIAPWALRNFKSEGVFVPVSSMSGTALGLGNNVCVASEPLMAWYWAEGPCPALDLERNRMRSGYSKFRAGSWVVEDRIYGTLGLRYIRTHTASYFKLCLKRLATVFVPFHPRTGLGRFQRVALTAYWLFVFPAGALGIARSLRNRQFVPMMLIAVVAVSVVPLVVIFNSPDLRYRLGIDLILCIFAAESWNRLRLRLREKYKKDSGAVSVRDRRVQKVANYALKPPSKFVRE